MNGEAARALEVLVVEDDEATAELEKRTLQRAGLGVKTVHTVADAIAHLSLEPVGVILLDYHLPDGDPWSVVRAAQAQTPRIPVVLATAMGNERVAAEALQHGVADYLPKTGSFWTELPSLVQRVAERAKIDERLRRTDALFRLISESGTDLIATIDLHGHIRQVSNALTGMLGYEPEDVLGKQSIDYVHPDDRARVARAFADRREHSRMTYRQLRKDGSFAWVEVNASVVQDQATGAPQEVLGVIRDITERKRAEDKFRALLEGSPEANVILDPTGSMVLVNARAEHLFGYERSELLGQPVDMLLPARLRSPQLWRRVRDGLDVTVQDGRATHEVVGRRKDASEFPADISLTWLQTEAERLVSCTIVDISHRKTLQDQELLLALGRELPRFEDVDSLVGYVTATIGRYLVLERCMFSEIDLKADVATTHADFARSGPSLCGRYPLSMFTSTVRHEMEAGRIAAVADTSVDARTAAMHPVRYAPFNVQAVVAIPVMNKGVWNGVILALAQHPRAWEGREIQLLQSIAERTWLYIDHVRMLRALRDSESQYRRLIESTHEGVWEIDAEANTRFVNKRLAEMLGYGVNEMLGAPVSRFCDEQALAELARNIERRKAGIAESHDFKFLRKDGFPVWTRLESSPLVDTDGRYTGALAMVADVTERKLTESDQQFLLELAELLTVTNEVELVKQNVVQRLGMHLSVDRCHFAEVDHAEHVATISHEWRTVAADSLVGTHSLVKLGDLLPELTAGRSVSVIDIQTDPRIPADAAAPYRHYRIGSLLVVPVHKEGQWVSSLTLMTTNPHVWRRREIALAHSVVERTSLCIERLQGIAALRDFNRDLERRVEVRTSELKAALREKEVLLKEIHHRVKNNLQVISSMLNLQALHLPDVEARRMFAESQGRVQSIALVHESLYQSKDLSSVSFAEYLTTLVNAVFQAQASPAGRVEKYVDAAAVRLPVSLAIPCGLIVNELVSNALKHAFPEGRDGKIIVRLLRREDARLELVVTDDGVGLPADKDPRDGNTLGLDLVYTFAEQVGAEVQVHSEHGTQFSIVFSEHEE